MAGKWAINIANASKYFLPSEWSAEHQTDGEFKGQLEESVLAYESLRKNDKGKNFYATEMQNKMQLEAGWPEKIQRILDCMVVSILVS